ncbi:TonB family protein [Geminocystis sp. GBBB08]|uniref:energy transducer TonB n=1 Tax=Geminocystis sp. GBBB08 TaxID=2604140 RepID=UPI0027E2FBD2|nr:TonB family protein [Geminocystis sp. GBBB08]MBL1210434.1 TonB family protein [Geminocystis sp. GBBB08]
MVTTTSSSKLSLQTNKVIKEINWSLLASISFHGLFFTFIFPQWNDQNNSKITAESTPVVELNSIEQTRLPNLNPRNSFNWNTLNTLVPSDNSLPPLGTINIPLPPESNTNTEFLPSFDNSSMANLPTPPSLPPAANLPPINNYYDQNNIPPSEKLSPPPINYSYNGNNIPYPGELPPPPPLNQNSLAALPSANNYDTPNTNFNSVPSTGKVIDINADPQQEDNIRQKLFANSDVQITANPRDIINGRVPQTFTQIDSNGNITVLPPSEVRPNLTGVSSKLQKQSENTSDEDARKNYVAWAKEVQDVTPQQITLTGLYPKDACVGKLEGTATYGVTVNSSGSVINSQLIKSSGYPLLNDQALRQIRSRNFTNNSGGSQPYHVYVNFLYDSQICPSLSISNIGEIPSTNAIKPTEVNIPEKNIPKTPSLTPKEETLEKKPNTVFIPQPESSVKTPEIKLPVENKPESSVKPPEIKLPVENKSESSVKPPEIKLPVENKSESGVNTTLEKSPTIDSKPAPSTPATNTEILP